MPFALRRVAAAAAVLGVGTVAALLGLGWLVTDAGPALPRLQAVAPEDVERALALARAHDPRRGLPGQVRLAFVGERDAALLLHHALARRFDGASTLEFAPGRARVRASLPLPALGRWLNVDATLAAAHPLPRVESLRVGALPLPTAWVPVLAGHAMAWARLPPEARALAGFVRGVQFARGSATVAYAYTPDARDRVLDALLPPADRERLRPYAAWLARLGETEPHAGSVSLARLLPPLLRLAADRSAGGADAAAENRAALVALALYANRKALDALLPAAVDGLPPQALRVTLGGRDDFPRHFLVSAVIAADSGSPLADAVGVWKELDDARRGSGFSFNDLAADRAGTRFGELAVRDPLTLQARLAGTLAETDIMPPVADLPEYLPEREFVARFGGVGAPAYRQMMAEVEARVAALPVWR